MDAINIDPVTFDFGEGKTRELKFTLPSVRHFKRSYGKPIWRVRLTGPGEIQPEMAMDHVCMTFVIQSALLHESPDLTFEATEKLLQSYISSGGDVFKIAAACSMAFNASGLFGVRKPTAEMDKELKDVEEEGRDPNAKEGQSLN